MRVDLLTDTHLLSYSVLKVGHRQSIQRQRLTLIPCLLLSNNPICLLFAEHENLLLSRAIVATALVQTSEAHLRRTLLDRRLVDNLGLQPVLHSAVHTAVHPLDTADEASACSAYISLAASVRKVMSVQGMVAEASTSLNHGNQILSHNSLRMLWLGLMHQAVFIEQCEPGKWRRMDTL